MKKKRTWLGMTAGFLIAVLCSGLFLTEAYAPEDEYREHGTEAEAAAESSLAAGENCYLLQTMAFSRCGHSVQRRVALPGDMAGSGLSQIQERYALWQIEEFQSQQIVMRREIELFCPMHKVLAADEAGQIVLAENVYGDGMAVICVYDDMLNQFEEDEQDQLLMGMGFGSREEAERWLKEH